MPVTTPILHNNFLKTLSALLFSSLFIFVSHFSAIPVSAYEAVNTASGSATVTATIPDHFDPSTPILISPTDGSKLSTSTPTFVWEASTDDTALSHYELFLDGSVLFANIPLNDANNSSYILTYDSSSRHYSLTPKASIANGSHTWKVMVYDTSDNSNTSVTWSFLIDTQAPSFVLTKIGNVVTSISAFDLDTIPTSPIELNANSPLLKATGEANSTVALTITIPGDPTQYFAGTIDGDGDWKQQLGVLPRDTIITLDFLITDEVGHITLLEGVQFIIKSQVLVIKDTTPEKKPLIEVPLVPPSEIVHDAIQEITEKTQPYTSQVLQVIPEATRILIRNRIANLSELLAWIVVIFWPTLTILTILKRVGVELSPRLMVKILQALGLLPKGPPQGVVYESRFGADVGFGVITITKQDDLGLYSEKTITDRHGIFRGLKPTSGKFRLSVRHPKFRFPTNQILPTYLTNTQFYKGGQFWVVQDSKMPLVLVPVDSIAADEKAGRNTDLSAWLANVWFDSKIYLANVWVIVWIITMLYPTIWNWSALVVQSGVILKKIAQKIRGETKFVLINDQDKKPVANSIITLSHHENQAARVICKSDRDGFGTARFKKAESAELVLGVQKPGKTWEYQNQAVSGAFTRLISGLIQLPQSTTPVELIELKAGRQLSGICLK